MFGYLVRRLAMTIPTLLLVAITVFALVRLIPGDPVQVMLGDSADPAQVEQLRRQMGLDQSIPVQFGYWLAKSRSAISVTRSPTGSPCCP
jgi:peptide/nickel transport system permease protein